MEALSRREEEEIETQAKQDALKHCDHLVKAFADCSAGRTFSVAFACSNQFKEMGQCTKGYMTEERLDAMKLDYIAHRSERGRQAVELLRQQRKEKMLKLAGVKEDQRKRQEELWAASHQASGSPATQ